MSINIQYISVYEIHGIKIPRLHQLQFSLSGADQTIHAEMFLFSS